MKKRKKRKRRKRKNKKNEKKKKKKKKKTRRREKKTYIILHKKILQGYSWCRKYTCMNYFYEKFESCPHQSFFNAKKSSKGG